MSDIIPIDQWTKIVESFQTGTMPMPFVKEIFLIECTIAGTTHVPDIEKKTAEITAGTLLAFQRDPGNPFDGLAIQILNQKNERIGFVPRGQNEVLARLMDAGKLIFGKVESKVLDGTWTKIAIRVFMRDL